jgi:hypothetical protein
MVQWFHRFLKHFNLQQTRGHGGKGLKVVDFDENVRLMLDQHA